MMMTMMVVVDGLSGLPIFFYLISTISRDDGDELS